MTGRFVAARREPGAVDGKIRFTAISLGLLLATFLAGSGCSSGAPPATLTDDLFSADGVALPEGTSAESVIRTLLARGGRDIDTPVTLDYPLEGSVFPPEIVAPTVLWHDPAPDAGLWLFDVSFEADDVHVYALTDGTRPEPNIDLRAVTESNTYKETEYQASARGWTPGRDLWDAIKRMSVERDATLTVYGLSVDGGRIADAEIVSRGNVKIRTSEDPVGAPIFYRDVPLMPTKTEEGVIQPLATSMFPLIQWRLRDLSEPSAPVVMEHLPTCANCHSFSADGTTLAMDMDGPGGDKGAYVVKDIEPKMIIEKEDVFTWNAFPGRPEAKRTFGLFARISPDGRYVVTTLNEEIFVSNFSEILFQQTFYPTRGILVWYDRETGEIKRLPGADDPDFVQANPVWSPDGRTIVFLREEARHAYSPGPRPTEANDPRETQMRFDLYRIPFNGGEGGVAEPLVGASNNGMSNSFPKYSHDGKWIVFVQAKNGLLLRPDSQLYIVPTDGGEARRMNCNTERMNSWHTWSPNSRWLAFSSKQNRPFTQLFLTHVDEEGNDTPPILVPNSTADNRAVNLPEFVNIDPDRLQEITTPAVEYRRQLDTARELKEQGEIDQAIQAFETSIELKDDYWETHLALADVRARRGETSAAIEHYRRALELNPRYFYTLNNLATALNRAGLFDEAIEMYGEALEVNPTSPLTHLGMGKALSRRGQAERAVVHFRSALELDPTLGRAHHEWGLVLARVRETPEAVRHYREAIKIEPGYAPAYDSLARILATHSDPSIRDTAEAVRLAEAACRQTGFEDEGFLHTLAVAYAGAGRYDDAVRTAERAAELARRHDRDALASEIEKHAAMFKQGKPLRIGS
jgi:tetratricopeptide (TPR) repeat protein